jgi:hypothetical protein
VDEVLDHRLGERGELDDHRGRQDSWIERKVPAPEPRCTTERARDVPHRGEVAHLLDRDLEDRASPARDRLGFVRGETLTLLERERRVEVRAHEVVLELGGFVQTMDQLLAAGHGHGADILPGSCDPSYRSSG